MRKESAIGSLGVIIFIAFLVFILLKEDKVERLYVRCDSFLSQVEAQKYFLKHNATHLDGNKNGYACEYLKGD